MCKADRKECRYGSYVYICKTTHDDMEIVRTKYDVR